MIKSINKELRTMKMHSLSEASEKGLIQHTIWVRDNMEERDFLKRSQDQVLINPKRVAMVVQNGGRLSLFVDDVSYCRKVEKARL
jgi:hypothetical protein